jgi:hypothetical protein
MMTALHEQRRELIEENAYLIRDWLALLDAEGQLALLRSMVWRYKLPELKTMNAHVKERLAAAQKERTP